MNLELQEKLDLFRKDKPEYLLGANSLYADKK